MPQILENTAVSTALIPWQIKVAPINHKKLKKCKKGLYKLNLMW
jgi:hypothetical protein